jgi:peptidoglycan/xylan/chitin deacetylase (PgdA/CDA1 family)
MGYKKGGTSVIQIDHGQEIDALASQLAESIQHLGGINADKLNDNTAKTSIKLLPKKNIEPLVTFIDDDGKPEVWTRLKPIFESRGVPCTLGIVSTWIDTDTFMTKEQVLELQNRLGWEIASHGRTHIEMGTVTDPNVIYNEIVLSKKELLEMGFNVRNLVYPFGQRNVTLKAVANKYYNFGVNTNKQTLVPDTNVFPFQDNFELVRTALGSYGAENMTYEFYKSAVDKAISENSWLIFMVHVSKQDAMQDQYLAQTIDYIISQGVKIVNLNDGMQYYGDRLNIEGFLKIDKNNKIASEKMVISVSDTTIMSASDADNISKIKSDYSKNHILYTKITYSNATGFPENAPGTLITDLSITENGYVRQTYHVYLTNNMYSRKTKADGTWTTWKRITNIALTTTQRNTSSTSFFKNVGDMVFDTTLGKPIWYNGTNWVDATGTVV